MSQQQVRPQTNSKKQVSCDASTEQKSKKFMKQMLALPISHIVFLRGIFEEKHFSDRYIGDLPIKMLKDSDDENTKLLVDWMRGCFDALDKDYLKSVTLTIHDPADARENPIESYTFSVAKKDDSCALSMQRNGKELNNTQFSEGNVKAAAIDCLTSLCDTIEVLDLLPDEVVMNMELAYYDDVTPKDYEPPGFQPSKPKSLPEAEEIGAVETKFHRLRVKVYTRQFAELARRNPTPSVSERGTSSLTDLSRRNPTPKVSERSRISLEDSPVVGVVSPAVRQAGEPSVGAAANPSGSSSGARGNRGSSSSTVNYQAEEAMVVDEDVSPPDPPPATAKGKGKTSANVAKKGEKRKADEDGPSEKNSEAQQPSVTKRARRAKR